MRRHRQDALVRANRAHELDIVPHRDRLLAIEGAVPRHARRGEEVTDANAR
jgi:hypothetical protein